MYDKPTSWIVGSRFAAIALVVLSLPPLVGSWAILGLETVTGLRALGLMALAATAMGAGVMAASLSRQRPRWASVFVALGLICAGGWYAAYATIG